MPSHHSPAVFVSSTCYDLSQIRDNIKSFIEEYGFIPVLSEFNSFPIDPLYSTVENCLRNVDERADIFVLIVGARYGSTDESGKSITNLEYQRARAKGIPIYVFISRTILEYLPVWRDNPEAKFKLVDSPKLFEFVDQLRNTDGIWSYSFDKSNEIIETLRNQLSFLFYDALQLWKKTKVNGIPESLSELKGEALRLVIEKPEYWEFRLYHEVLKNKLGSLKHLKNDKEHGIAFGKTLQFDNEELIEWLIKSNSEIIHKLVSFNALFSKEVTEKAFGPPGTPGDPEMIIYIADRLSTLYQELLEWSIQCLNIVTDERFNRLLQIHAKGVNNPIQEIEEFRETFSREISNLIQNPPQEDEIRHLTLTLALTYPEGLEEELSAELNRLVEELDVPSEDESE